MKIIFHSNSVKKIFYVTEKCNGELQKLKKFEETIILSYKKIDKNVIDINNKS